MDRFEAFLTRLGLSGAGAWCLHHFFGENLVPLFAAYVTFILLDTVTGTLAAAIRHELRSDKAWTGALKKLMGLCAVAMGHAVDQAVGSGDIARNTMIVLLCSYEFKSIVENLAVADIIVPASISMLFEKALAAREAAEEKDNAPVP